MARTLTLFYLAAILNLTYGCISLPSSNSNTQSQQPQQSTEMLNGRPMVAARSRDNVEEPIIDNYIDELNSKTTHLEKEQEMDYLWQYGYVKSKEKNENGEQ